MNKSTLPAVFGFLVLLLPLFLWEYIRNQRISFSIALFVICMSSFYAFKILQDRLIKPEKDSDRSNAWFAILSVVVMLVLFFVYSSRLFDIIMN